MGAVVSLCVERTKAMKSVQSENRFPSRNTFPVCGSLCVRVFIVFQLYSRYKTICLDIFIYTSLNEWIGRDVCQLSFCNYHYYIAYCLLVRGNYSMFDLAYLCR